MHVSKAMPVMPVILTATSLALIAAPAPQGGNETEQVKVNATITAIDKTNRMVTLTGPQGKSVTVQAGEGVQRFNDLKVGDQVAATYTESIAWSVRPAGQAAPPAETQTVTAREGGPGGTVTVQQTVSLTVEQIDRSVPSVTVKGPQGNIITFHVRNPKNLENLKIGDKVDVTYTQGLLMRVDPPTK